MTIGVPHLGLVTQACARVIPTPRIARTEVIANTSLRPISGFALRTPCSEVGPDRPGPSPPGDEFTSGKLANSPTHQFTNSGIGEVAADRP